MLLEKRGRLHALSNLRRARDGQKGLLGMRLLLRLRQPAKTQDRMTVDVEEPQLTVEGLAENADPDTAPLLRKFSEPLGAWDIEELSAMGTAEILARAYGEDKNEGIAMWSALLYAAGSRLKAPREARWLLHSCCPYGTDDLSSDLLDELQRDEKLSRLVF